ncbi:DUF1801 domain-containing protein [Occallatibacter riparius]|uniref:DUF1801 domain-containing protein n=1 Tax=Occallatibacter riparius TaxID=1002689 RepID=A0A9J7BRU8_9BACT|nr:DUF1801 domain-containing protein [Occallatibacter riparius]UWZ83773.1 DUF1801 domain-containing protein [Occallatibacter riparius]
MKAGNDAERQLASFIAKYTPEIAALALEIRARMRAKYPSALELVYDNYNALAIGYAPGEKTSEAIFSIALYPRWVSLFFLQAKGLPDPDRILKGSGTVVKHVVLRTADDLEHPSVRALMQEAVQGAKVPFAADGAHRLIIKSVSEKQRPRRPAEKSKVAVKAPRSTGAATRIGASQ